ncbi:hypothetical protein HPB52_010252 [Rhipicephalus sanguineus]|uniref:Uncharacterized protein n=1 Tax=Rhipicephalus sanguineus TaxID=34632 RepID=A0A9D4SSW8_RHISA|nr:hypothetical protein HPB52_010252 [Rhipicephalus sanguineus]
MPAVIGRLEGTLVTVLRDTGCNTVVVKRSLVPDSKLTGNTRVIRLLDRSEKSLPEAEVFIHSPFFRGVAVTVCKESPLYEVILGNIAGAVPIADPDYKQTDSPSEKVTETATKRSKSKEVTVATGKSGKLQNIPTPQVDPLNVSPEELRQLQSTDQTLEAFEKKQKIRSGARVGEARVLWLGLGLSAAAPTWALA